MAEASSGLRPGDVYRACDESAFTFETANELPELSGVIGQARAVSALEFGVGVDNGGYNVFALGPAGTGKSTAIYEFLSRQAASLPAPDDWVYVHNFEKPHQPTAIHVAAGRGHEFRKHMEQLVEDLKAAVTQAFESEEYAREKKNLVDEFAERQKNKYDTLSEKAEAEGFAIVPSPAGVVFIPKSSSGEPMSQEEYEALSPEQHKTLDEGRRRLNDELQQLTRLARRDERDGRETLRELDRQITSFAAKHLIDDVCERWCDAPGVTEYLHAVLDDVVENADDFKKSDEESPPAFPGLAMQSQHGGDDAFRRYRVNVLVDNSDQAGAPVVTESNPILQHIVGQVEHQAQFGALVTDFNMIKSGSLHTANGGFLVLDARDVLLKPYAWDALKRTLKTGDIRIEDVAQQIGFATTASLKPEPIPFKAKIVLIGEAYIYYLLYAMDPDFQELFKIKADFDTVIDRTPETEQLYASFVGALCREHELAPFSPSAVGRIIEHCSRLVSDQNRMTTRFADVAYVATEASYWARNGHQGASEPLVERAHVQKAIDQNIYRSNRVEERLREMITDATVLVDVAGAVVGQVNGLSVASTGDYAFGRPSRITATHRLGDGEVIDIEREVEMGGPIHSKGVMILAGYLGSKYAPDHPLSLAARLVFEQSYSGVEGDSASSTELYALLSSLSGVPIQQRFAVTGSVNQLGQVQAIGGVNEKIEGFFALCKVLGLEGDQGVLIPRANVRHLMLNDPVREAIAEGSFHVIPVSTIDEGISVLTGVSAGAPDASGLYPEASVNRRVVDRLTVLAEKALEIAAQKRGPDPSRT